MNIESNIIELTEVSVQAPQPERLKVQLKGHQLACLHKCIELENGPMEIPADMLPSSISSTSMPGCQIVSASMRTRIGIIGDKVGSGKSLVILALVDSNNSSMNEFISERTFTYGNNNTVIKVQQKCNTSKLNLLVIPHNLVSQWSKYIQDFAPHIKHMIINKQKHFENLTPSMITEYNLVVVTNTFYNTLSHIIRATNIQLKRVIFDEIDTNNISTGEPIDSSFYWFVTASYTNLLYPRGHGRWDRDTRRYIVIADGMRCNGFVKSLFTNLFSHSGTGNKCITNLFIVKSNESFIDASMMLPPPQCRYIKCRTPYTINILNGIVDRHVIACLNADDIDGAIRHISPSHKATEENIINILIDKISMQVHNVNSLLNVTKEMLFESEQHRQAEIDKLNKRKDEYENKIMSITERIRQNGSCCICYGDISNKTIIKCCSNSFCFKCLNLWLTRKQACPLCKANVTSDDMYVVCNNVEEIETTSQAIASRDAHPEIETCDEYDKLQNLQVIMKSITRNNPNSKIVIFSSCERTFTSLSSHLIHNNIRYSILKGNTDTINCIVRNYKETDKLNVLLANPTSYGCGLNLENTTDIIMMHKFETDMEKQVIGRGQRLGRNSTLRVWYLLYQNEMEMSS